MNDAGIWTAVRLLSALVMVAAIGCEQPEHAQPVDQAPVAPAVTETPIETTPTPTAAVQPQAQALPAGDAEAEAPLPMFAIGRLEHEAAVTDLAWSGDGAVIATASSDGQLRLWDARSFALTRTLEGPPGADRRVGISRDGAILVATAGPEIRVFDGGTGGLRHTLRHEGPTFAVAVSADAGTIASGGSDGLRIWGADGGALHQLAQRGERVVSLAFSADGRALASGWSDRRVRLVDVASGRVTRTIKTGELPASLAYSDDGLRLAARVGAEQLGVFDTAKGKRSATLELAHPLAFGAGGALLIAALEQDEAFAVTLVDVGSGSIVRGFLGHSGALTDASFSPDSSNFASASVDTTVLIWMAP